MIRGSAGALGGIASQQMLGQAGEAEPDKKPLELPQYEPRSMLHGKETEVVRAHYPVIDIHTHLSQSTKAEKGVSLAPEWRFLAPPQHLLPVMERRVYHANAARLLKVKID